MGDIFVRRLTGVAMLDVATYEEVEADRAATPQALAIIVLSSLAAGIGVVTVPCSWSTNIFASSRHS